MPPAFAGLVPGVATQADLAAAFAASETVKDRSLGGAAKVRYADEPAVRTTLAAKDPIVRGEAWFVGDGGADPKLQRLELVTTQTGACKWIEDNVGKDPESTRRAGSNRKFGANAGSVSYSLGTTDGKLPVDVECNPSQREGVAIETILYSIVRPGGPSMQVQTE